MADPDKLFQDALNAIDAVKTPDTGSMMVTLQNMVQQGILTPEQMQTALVDRNAFDNIVSSPEFAQAQQSALSQLQQIGSEGGLTAMDRAKIEDINSETNQVNKGQEQAIMQNARERGIGGSGLEMASRLQAQQSAADRASRQGTDVAALAEQRALDAIQGAGEMGGRMQEAEFQRGATKAGAANAIDAANAAMMNQGRMFNTQNINAANEKNLMEKQRIHEGNVGLQNEEEQFNKSLPELQFQNEMAKAGAKAGTYNQWGGAEAAQANQKTGFKNQLLAGGLQAGGTALGTAFGGPVGGAAGGQIAKSAYDPNVAPNQYARMGYNCGGMVSDYKDGGMVPGEAAVEGDSPMNDTVEAKLSPGELVIPRSLVSDFVKQSKSKGKAKVDHEDIANVFKALASMKEKK